MFRPLSRARSGLCAACLALLPVFATPDALAQEAAAEQCLDPQVCPIPYVRLSKQETEPFLFLGKVVDKDHPRFGDYRRALRRFPDVRSCLVEQERGRHEPDMRLIDWREFGSSFEVHVCLFRIASSLEDPDTIKSWFVAQGFRVGELNRIFGPSYVPKQENEAVAGMTAFMTGQQRRRVYHFSLWSWIELFYIWITGDELSRGSGFSILFSHSGKVVGIGVQGSSIFN